MERLQSLSLDFNSFGLDRKRALSRTRVVSTRTCSPPRNDLSGCSGYTYRDGPHVFGELAKHLDATPGLEVTLVLNIERWQREKKHRIKKVVARFADRFWKREWPGQNRPLVYYDRRSVNTQLPGKLHAKVVVADEEHVFVTSANLTRRAWDDNVELGILVRDADLAGSVIAHVQGLIDARVLWKLPRETGPAAS